LLINLAPPASLTATGSTGPLFKAAGIALPANVREAEPA